MNAMTILQTGSDQSAVAYVATRGIEHATAQEWITLPETAERPIAVKRTALTRKRLAH